MSPGVSDEPTAIPSGALAAKMGIEWVEVDPKRVVARMPVEGNTQPLGLLHGGASGREIVLSVRSPGSPSMVSAMVPYPKSRPAMLRR